MCLIFFLKPTSLHRYAMRMRHSRNSQKLGIDMKNRKMKVGKSKISGYANQARILTEAMESLSPTQLIR